jgi:hypothetical protein
MHVLSVSQEAGFGVAMKSMETYVPNGTAACCESSKAQNQGSLDVANTDKRLIDQRYIWRQENQY